MYSSYSIVFNISSEKTLLSSQYFTFQVIPLTSNSSPCPLWCQFTSQVGPALMLTYWWRPWVTSWTWMWTSLCWCCPAQPASTPTSSWIRPCRVDVMNEALWSRSHCFLYDCLWGCFDFIMSVTLSLTLGALYVCQYIIIMLFWLAVYHNVRRQE